jgi:Leucine-rich repeat (LRR) protein
MRTLKTNIVVKSFKLLISIVLSTLFFTISSYSQNIEGIAENKSILNIENGSIFNYSEITNLKNNNLLLEKISVANLENSKLNEVPEYIFNCTNLESLILKNNNISKLPIEIRKLYNLRVLDLSNTDIQVIPEEISQLKLLKELHLTYEIWQYRIDELRKITNAKIVLE